MNVGGPRGGVDVSVVIVAYRTRAELARLLPTVGAGVGDLAHEVIIVDNASGDGTAAWLAEAWPSVKLVALEENVGFARGVNCGAAAAVGEYLVLLNPDTEVRPGALVALVGFARSHPGAGLVGGRTLTDTGEVEPSCCWGRPTLWSTLCFATLATTLFRGKRFVDPESMPGWPRDTVREVGVVTGCLLAVSAETWQRLGGFDPRFFMYGEDTDLSIRAWKAGYRPVITPDAEVIHTIGASSSVPATRRVMIMRGKVTVFRKHWGAVGARTGVGLLATGVALRAGLGRLKRVVTGSVSADQEGWIGAWAQRSEWLEGYPERPEPALAGVGTPDTAGATGTAGIRNDG
jgi:hypothetical protein